MSNIFFLNISLLSSLTITALISRSRRILSHASGHDTSASRLFTIVPFRHSLNKNTHSTTIAIYLMPAHRKCLVFLVYELQNHLLCQNLQKVCRHSLSTTPSPGCSAEKQMGQSTSAVLDTRSCSSVAKKSM